jgi:hypothetical protein
MSVKWTWVIVFIIGASFFLSGFLILLDQYMRIGVWIQWQDLFHHETFALAFFAVGVGVFIGSISHAVIRGS